MYVHTPFPNIVYALDLNADGAIKWKYEPVQDPNVIPVMCCDTVNRGVAYAPAGDGYPALIILHQADTTVVALNADTGEEVWKVKSGDPSRAETGTNAPMVVKDKVISGVSGGEFGVQGYVVAYNLKDGSEAWRAYSMGPDDQIADRSGEDHEPRQAGRSRLRARTPGKAISGRSAAARRGDGIPTIRSSTSSTTAPATPRPGTRTSVRATTAGR